MYDERRALPLLQAARKFFERPHAAGAEGERLLPVRKGERSVRIDPRLIVGIVRKFEVVFALEIAEVALAQAIDGFVWSCPSAKQK